MEKIDLINIAVTMCCLGWFGSVMFMFKPESDDVVVSGELNGWAVGSFIFMAVGGFMTVILYYI